MDAAAIDADPMLRLLTDALRRGPGSPEWHKAVSDLRDVTTPEADEYRLLIAARERLESGRAYREVRAGPAFTRELFGQLDRPADTSKRLPVGTIVRLLCLLALVAAIALLIVWAAGAKSDNTDALANRLFVTPAHDWEFFGGLPKGLTRSDSFNLSLTSDGVRADAQNAHGGLLALETLDLQPGICVEARLDVKPGPVLWSLDLIRRRPAAYTGATERGRVLIARDTTNVLTLQGDGTQIDSITTQNQTITQPFAPRPLSAGTHVVRIKADAKVAVVDVDGQLLWAGPHDIGDSAYLEFGMTRTAPGGPGPTVQGVRVLTP